jgi:hypothetical protein
VIPPIVIPVIPPEGLPASVLIAASEANAAAIAATRVQVTPLRYTNFVTFSLERSRVDSTDVVIPNVGETIEE